GLNYCKSVANCEHYCWAFTLAITLSVMMKPCLFVSGKKSDDPRHPDYVPSLFSFTSTTDKTQAVRNLERYLQFQNVCDNKNRELAATALLNINQSPVIKQEEHEEEIQVKIETGVQWTEVQTEETHNDIASLYEQIKSLNIECQSLRDKVHTLESELKRRTLDASQFDDSKMKYFTGLPNLQTFMLVLSYVSSVFPATTKQSLKPTQELLLTLMKLRLNLSEDFLGYLFGIHQSTVSRVFRRWINVMASRLHPLILWPEREDLRRSLPMCFQKFFKNCVGIIDCFELFIERPSDLTARAQTWSNHKQHNTIKFLISVTPQGSISFVSKAWGGCVTDKHLTEHSGFLDKLLPGDLVLANQGFMIEDSVGLFCAELTPPQGKKQLSQKEIESAQEISRVKIPVEKVIRMLRQKYTILGSTLSASLIRLEQSGQVEDSLINKIVLTCCALCNMCKSTVPSD
uniref:DDE Tnp4 domain-containing protein n=1 Tax=Sphaeramia orbicularis TaxID=375764 RepID=A0A672YAS2_9TELE